MAITDSFNLSNALNSQAYAYKCWYNYNYGSNTMGISSKDMGKITQTWNSQLDNWHAVALDDENAYEIEDDDFSTAKNNGKENAKDKTGYDGNQGGQVARTVVDSGLSVTGAAVTTFGTDILGSTVSSLAGKTVGKTVGKVAAKKGAEAGTNAGTKAGNGAWIVAAPLSLAVGTAYTAKKPNKDEKKACDELQNEMLNANNALYTAQGDMATAGDEVTALSDEAQVLNEDANDEIEDQKSEYDTYKASYDALMSKVESGETLTDDEKDLLRELAPLMQELGEGIGETQEDATDTTSEIYDEMGNYQEAYDTAAETVAEVQGLTDYAASFDESTRTMCYVEAGAQTLNAASGTKAAWQAGQFAASGGWITAWAWGFAAAGAAGAVQSGVGAAQQFQWAGDVGTEIGMRKETQDINTQTNDVYDESIADYEGYMSGVEELELEMPKDMEDIDEVIEGINEGTANALGEGDGAGGTNTSGTTTTTSTSTSTDPDKNKEKEKEV